MASIGRQTIFINGRFLTQHMAGVNRFCTEIVKALDELLAGGQGPLSEHRWQLLVPPKAVRQLDLRCIETRAGGIGGGHFWEQVCLPGLAHGGILINLSNCAPVLHGNNFVILHDASPYRMPEIFDWRYAKLHQVLGRCLSKSSRIGTVSQFSRGELAEVLRLRADDIFVAPNSCEHMSAIESDESVLRDLGVDRNAFFLMVGSPVPNKNFPRAIAAYLDLNAPNRKMIVVGSFNPAYLGQDADVSPHCVIFTGRVSDAKLAALYRNAAALVFPSVYEGFGIPPLEAMVHGCPVLAAAIAPVREVCGDAAIYFDPQDLASMSAAMRLAIDDPESLRARGRAGLARSALFSWKASAGVLLAEIEQSLGERSGNGGTSVARPRRFGGVVSGSRQAS